MVGSNDNLITTRHFIACNAHIVLDIRWPTTRQQLPVCSIEAISVPPT